MLFFSNGEYKQEGGGDCVQQDPELGLKILYQIHM